VVEIDVPIARAFPRQDFLLRTQATLNELLGLAPDAVTVRMTDRGDADLLGLAEEAINFETVRGNAEVTLAVHDYSDVGPKKEMELQTHMVCVMTPIGDRPPLAWALAAAMAIVTAEAGNGIVIDEYGIWTGERANNPAALRKRLTAPKSYSDPESSAREFLDHRAVNGRKVLS
jgi:hypothetical protein